MFKLVLYILGICGLSSGWLAVKRNEEKESLLMWLTPALLGVIALHAFLGSVISVLVNGICVYVISSIDLVLGSFLWILAGKKLGFQKYKFCWEDAVVLVAVAYLTVSFFRHRFPGFIINFASIDSGAHFTQARYVANSHGILSNMCISAVNTGLAMESFMKITGDFANYKTFILAECFYFFLSGSMIYSLFRFYTKSKGESLLAGLIALIYMEGYPKYSTIFGFSYLGLTVTMICFLLFVMQAYFAGRMKMGLFLASMNVGLQSIFIGYTLFVPSVFFGAFLAILIDWKKKGHKIFKLKTIGYLFSVFFLPSVLGMLRSIGVLFMLIGKNNTGAATEAASASGHAAGLMTDGGCYNEFYSNFILMFPLVIVGLAFVGKMLFNRYKESEREAFVDMKEVGLAEIAVTFIHAIFVMGVFCLVLKHKASVYYFSKTLSLLWLLGFMMAFLGGLYLWRCCRAAAIGTLVTILLIFGSFLTRFDAYVLVRNDRMIRVGTDAFLNIYAFNRAFMDTPPISQEDLDMMKYIKEEMSDKRVAVVGTDFYDIWYKQLTGQEDQAVNAYVTDLHEYIANSEAEYTFISQDLLGVYEIHPGDYEVISSNNKVAVLKNR